MASLKNKSFGVALKEFAANTSHKMDVVVRKVTLDLDARIVKRTPVLTGRAQNNWNIGVDNPDLSVTQEGEQSEQAVINEAEAKVKAIKAGAKVFLTNNLPYIVPLEEGHSAEQAPNGMVAVTLAEYPQIVVKAAKETKAENP